MSQTMNAPARQELTQEQKVERLKGFIDAAVLANPSLKDRLTLGAATQLLLLPDSTLGWNDAGAMTFEIRCLAIITHLRIGAIPGMRHVFWLGNGFYPSEDFWTYTFNEKRLKGLIKVLDAPKFEPMTLEEMNMFGLDELDRYIKVSAIVEENGKASNWIGYGIIGADELAYRSPNKNKPKIGMDTKKNTAKTLMTRAMLDMLSKNMPVDGITTSAEEILESRKEREEQPIAPHDPEKILEMQSTPGPVINYAELAAAEMKALDQKVIELADKVRELGGDPQVIVTDDVIELPVAIALLETWIQNNQPKPDPEPPKTRKTRAKKETTEPVDKPKVDNTITVTKQGPVTIVEKDLLDENPEVRAENVIDENYTAEEVREPILEDFDFPDDEEDPIYSGTTEQKKAIRQAVREAKLPQTGESLLTLAAAMKGQPMSKLMVKALAMTQNLTAAEKAQVPKEEDHAPTPEAKERLKVIAQKVVKIGGKTMQLLEGKNVWNIIESGNSVQVDWAISKLEKWFIEFSGGKVP